jgi:hypothetical protein
MKRVTLNLIAFACTIAAPQIARPSQHASLVPDNEKTTGDAIIQTWRLAKSDRGTGCNASMRIRRRRFTADCRRMSRDATSLTSATFASAASAVAWSRRLTANSQSPID